MAPPGGTYVSDSVVTVTATAATGWHFEHWEGDAEGEARTVTVTMHGDKSVTAVFGEGTIRCTLTASVTGGNGTISPTKQEYDKGTVVPLVAAPDDGYTVKAWTGADNVPAAGSHVNTVTMTEDKTVTVEFEASGSDGGGGCCGAGVQMVILFALAVFILGKLRYAGR